MNAIRAMLILAAILFPVMVGTWPAIGVSLGLVHIERRIKAEGMRQ